MLLYISNGSHIVTVPVRQLVAVKTSNETLVFFYTQDVGPTYVTALSSPKATLVSSSPSSGWYDCVSVAGTTSIPPSFLTWHYSCVVNLNVDRPQLFDM